VTVDPNQIAAFGVIAAWLSGAIALIPGVRLPRGTGARARSGGVGGSIGMLLQGVGFFLAFNWRRPRLSPFVPGSPAVQWAVAMAAITLAWVSVAFLIAALRTLGKQWSLLPRLADQHELIERGPYAVVRHPIYAGLLGLLFATAAAMTTPIAAVAVVAFYVPGTLIRVRLEERLLRTMFGERYDEYSRRVPALLPLGRETISLFARRVQKDPAYCSKEEDR
jgi:protein-S-isoprenylcysteine O-methyltransferase Ste14